MHPRSLFLLTAVLAATASTASAQPGGDRDRGRGGPPSGFSGGPPSSSSRSSFSMDPNERFNQMSGGRESFNLNQLPQDQKDRLVRFAPMMGLQIPPDGTVTRTAYVAASEQMRQRFGGGMRGGPPGTPGTTVMVAPGGTAMPGTPGAPPSFTPTPGMGGPPSGFTPNTSSDRGRDGFDPTTMPDDRIREFMRRYDQDGDGRISATEAQRSDRLRDGFATYDVNRDGFIDLSEYRGYLISRMSRDQSGSTPSFPGGQPNWNGTPGWGGVPPGTDPRQPPIEDPRPVVFRYGRLPKEFPYSDLDEDRDGQIGLYEWKAAGKSLAEFKELDLNRDGFLTAEEFLRARPPAPPAPATADRGGSMADEPRTDRGRDDRGSSSSSKDDRKSSSRDDRRPPSRDDRGSKEEKRQPGANPFSRSRG